MARTDPHSVADPAEGRVRSLTLDLEVDFEQQRLHGTARLDLEDAAGGDLHLDTRDLTIDGVSDDDGAALEWELGEPDPIVGTPLRVRLRPDTRALQVRYATSPEASALQWLEPPQTAGGRHPYLFSQCQAIHARSVVPLQDTPSVRFPYRARLTVPEPLTAVMSAAPGEPEAGPRPGTRTLSFSMPQPIPSYLLALAVGDLASEDLGPRSRVYTEPAMLEAAAWEFAGVDDMLRAAEELFGPYRWDRFDFLVMPPAFPYGGMENPRLTFLTPTLVAGDRSLVAVLAHELAHSWTGNLVTNATNDDFWLNEGFTVWAERRIIEALYGDEAVAMAAAIGWHGLQEELGRFGEGSPFTRLKTDLAGVDPDEVFSRVPYEKGFLFLSLLERTAGREAWDGFVRDYIDHWGFSSITTAQFEAWLREHLPGPAAEVDVETWLHDTDLPEDAPRYASARLDRLQALAAAFGGGEQLDPDEVDDWTPDDWQVFLAELPRPVSPEACVWLEERFRLTESNNPEILADWLVVAVQAGHEPALVRARDFLGEVGRMKYLNPLYQALAEQDPAGAADVFGRFADTYHPIARAGVERVLAKGGE